MRWLAGRPLTTLHAWGALLGWLAYLLSPSYRKRLKAHTQAVGMSAWQRWAAVAHAGAQRVQSGQTAARQPADQPEHVSYTEAIAELKDNLRGDAG